VIERDETRIGHGFERLHHRPPTALIDPNTLMPFALALRAPRW